MSHLNQQNNSKVISNINANNFQNENPTLKFVSKMKFNQKFNMETQGWANRMQHKNGYRK